MFAQDKYNMTEFYVYVIENINVVIQKISATKISPNLGKHCSKETRAKISAASDETRATGWKFKESKIS
jgi:hypothetical protein